MCCLFGQYYSEAAVGGGLLFGQLPYVTGLRINAALQLRVKDIDFENQSIIVRCGKGGKDRVVRLPASLIPAMRGQLTASRICWRTDRANGRSGVERPKALEGAERRLTRTDSAAADPIAPILLAQVERAVRPRRGRLQILRPLYLRDAE